MKQPIFIRIFHNEKLEGIKQFQIPQIIFGTSAEAQIPLAGDNVAPLHALIEERDAGYYLSDLGSETGTRRNGEPILDEKLESGDQIEIGNYRLQFFVGIPKPLTAPAPVTGASPIAPSIPASAPVAPPPTQRKTEKIWDNNEIKKEVKTAVPVEVPVEVPKVKPKPQTPERKVIAPSPGAMASAETYKSTKTFAPPSHYQDLSQVIKPGKGSLVEIVVAWRERILSVHHFNEAREITVGANPSADVMIPMVRGAAFPLVKIGSLATIRIAGQMNGEFIKADQTMPIQDLLRQNRLRGRGSIFELDLNQGEMVRLSFGDSVFVYIRYTSETPKPAVAPIFDMTAAEVTGVLLAAVVSGIFSIYMMVYAPQNMDDQNKVEEPIRFATVTFNRPKPPAEKDEKPTETAKEKIVVKAADKEQVRQKAKVAEKAAPNPGRAAEVAPKETKDKQKKFTSAKPGGAIKTAPKEGANAKSEKPDPTKVGLLGVFGSKGALTKLDKAYSGSGELQGMADSANGYAGQAEDRAGDGIGTKLKDTGAGGKGTATIGIAGVGTKGRGSGNYGYGNGGLGVKGNVGINLEGSEPEFSGSMDRDAIKRVIMENKRTIQNCYNMQLNRNADLYGKIVIKWIITEGGRVRTANVDSSTLANSEVGNCIVRALKTWKFPDPPPDAEGVVSFPFVFTSQ